MDTWKKWPLTGYEFARRWRRGLFVFR